jgi:hypothetical protein
MIMIRDFFTCILETFAANLRNDGYVIKFQSTIHKGGEINAHY